MNMEIIKLRQELDTLKANQKKVVRSFKYQIDLLSQFIIRITRFYEGVQIELDEELNILRSHLGGKSHFALTENSISKVNNLIVRYSDNLKHKNRKTLLLLQDSIKALQSKDKISDTVKKQALAFLTHLQQAETTIYNALPQFEQAIMLYKQALDNTPVTTGASADIANHPQQTDELHQQICDEIQQLISQLMASKGQDAELNTIRNKIIKGISHQELLECCLILVRAILKDVLNEREHAEKFVHSIHDALCEMTTSIDSSIKQSETHLQQKKQANDAIKSQITNIGEAVESADDLALLKQQAAEYLTQLSASMDARDNADHQEQLNLINLLNDMQSQLNKLEQQAATYKSHLSEQNAQSRTDTLTQVANRLAYSERVEIEFARWQRYNHPLSIALIDIDLFKSINDNYGHTAGDKTLQVIAQHIQSNLRDTDFLARWGGEEFVLLLPQTSSSDLSQPLENIREKIARIPFKFKNKHVSISVSIGATQFSSKDTIESAFERTDQALYQAKNEGRNRCIIK